jgi:hypothetical protein
VSHDNKALTVKLELIFHVVPGAYPNGELDEVIHLFSTGCMGVYHTMI